MASRFIGRTVLRGTEKKTALRRGKSWREAFVAAATIPCRGFMKMCVARHSRTRSQLPGPWSAFADMEVASLLPGGATGFSLHSFARRVFLVRPGAGPETFIRGGKLLEVL